MNKNKIFICCLICFFTALFTLNNQTLLAEQKTPNVYPPTQNNFQGIGLQSDITIGHVKTRDKIITIKKSPKGIVFTLKTKKGDALGSDMIRDDLLVKFPELKEILEKSYAFQKRNIIGTNDTNYTILDATLRR